MEALILIYEWTAEEKYADIIAYRRANVPGYEQKYQARYRIGDVIEVRPDGYWSDPVTGKGYRQDRFRLIRCPGVAVMTSMTQPLDDEENNTVRKKRYRINTAGLVGDTVTPQQLASRLVDKDAEVMLIG